MRLWADVYDAVGNRLGEGPVTTLVDAYVRRVLDGVGTVSFRVPLNDKRAVDLLQNEARVRLYVERDGVTREIGRGIVRNRSIRVDASGTALVLDGPDDLDELKRWNTLLARIYSNIPVETIAADLTALAGWTADVDGGLGNLSARFDGASVLKALQELVKQQGLHLRQGATEKSVEIGAFGDAANLRLYGPTRIQKDAYHNRRVAFIERLTVGQSTEAVANWFVPLGQGEGEAALTLAKSTRTSPYTIKTTVVNDKTHYYLADDASIATYGTIQKVGTYRQIGAVSNNEADLVNAANALYDAAAAWLQRNSVRLDTYGCTVRKADVTVRPGDKVRLVYSGDAVDRDGVPHQPVSIDADVWVMRVTERVGVEGVVLDLELANVDRVELDAQQLIIGALEDIELRNTRVQTYPSNRSFVYKRELDATHSATIPVWLTTRTTELNQATINFATRPFRSTATGAASGGGATSSAGGDHRHRMFEYGGSVITRPLTRYLCRVLVSGSYNQTDVNINSGAGTGDLYTQDASGDHTHTVPNHTHPQQYGIHDDSQYPNTVSVYIDGVDRTAALGGPWAVGGGAADVTIDVTPYLRDAAGGMRQKHTVELRCASGQGEIEATVEIFETVQAIISSN